MIGNLGNNNFSSKPKGKTDTICPISWAVLNNELIATEGIENASSQLVELAHKIQTVYCNKILQALPIESHQRFSNLSIAVDQKKIFNTNLNYFVETNDNKMSILTPQEKKEPELMDKKVIPRRVL